MTVCTATVRRVPKRSSTAPLALPQEVARTTDRPGFFVEVDGCETGKIDADLRLSRGQGSTCYHSTKVVCQSSTLVQARRCTDAISAKETRHMCGLCWGISLIRLQRLTVIGPSSTKRRSIIPTTPAFLWMMERTERWCY